MALLSWLDRFKFSKDFSDIFLSAITLTFYLYHLNVSAFRECNFMI